MKADPRLQIAQNPHMSVMTAMTDASRETNILPAFPAPQGRFSTASTVYTQGPERNAQMDATREIYNETLANTGKVGVNDVPSGQEHTEMKKQQDDMNFNIKQQGLKEAQINEQLKASKTKIQRLQKGIAMTTLLIVVTAVLFFVI